jgi:hypothetical protein
MKIDLNISLIHEEKWGGGRRWGGYIKKTKNCSHHVHIMFLNVINDVPEGRSQ